MPLFKRYDPSPDAHRQVLDPEVLQAIPPEMEHYEGDNIPYRGVVNHGVPVQGEFTDLDELEEEASPPVVYVPAPEPPDPVPVVVMNKAPRERKMWRAQGWVIGTNVTPVLGRNDNRTRAIIKNVQGIAAGTVVVHVAHDPAKVGWTNGEIEYDNYMLAQKGEVMEIHSSEPVYVSSESDVEPCRVSVFEEYTVEE